MSNFILGTLLLLATFLSSITMMISMVHVQNVKEYAIEIGCAQYNSKTGDWEWIENK